MWVVCDGTCWKIELDVRTAADRSCLCRRARTFGQRASGSKRLDLNIHAGRTPTRGLIALSFLIPFNPFRSVWCRQRTLCDQTYSERFYEGIATSAK